MEIGGLDFEGGCFNFVGDLRRLVVGRMGERGESDMLLGEKETAGGDVPSVSSNVSISLSTALHRSSDLISFIIEAGFCTDMLGLTDIPITRGDIWLGSLDSGVVEGAIAVNFVALLTTNG